MTTLMELAVRLVGDVSQYNRAMDEAEGKARRTAAEIGRSMQQAGASLIRLGTGMTAAVTLPIVAAGTAAINAASDLEETRNKVRVVFGEMGDAVLAWSQDSARAFGMSRNQALTAAGTYGNLFITMGLGAHDAQRMSTSLVQLAADLASFNNADPSDVLQSIQSGLVGQVEPLRKYGVVLSEAAVQAKALEMGLVGAGGELSEAAKLAARYAIVMEQTGTAQGDFARTSDGLANSQRIMKAQLGDAAATLGEQLLPYALKFVQWVTGLIAKFEVLSPTMKKWIVIIAAIAAVIGPVLIVFGSLLSALGAIIPVIAAIGAEVILPIVAVIGAVIAVVALLVAAWKNNWLGIRDIVTRAIEWIRNRIQLGLQFIKMLWILYGQQWWERVKETWGRVMDAFRAALDWARGVVQDGLNYIHNMWAHHGRSVQTVVRGLWNLVINVITVAWGIVHGIISIGLAIVQAFWERHGAAIMKVVNNLWQMLKNTFKAFVDAFGFIFDAFAAAFKGDWYGFGENLRKAWDVLWDMLVKNLKLAWENIKIVFGEWWRNIKDFFKNLDMKSIGKWLIDGLINGLNGGSGSLIETIKKIGKAFMDAVKGFFGIKSPSALMRLQVGYQLGMGTLLGWQESIENMIAGVPGTLGGLVPAALSPIPALNTPMPALAAVGNGRGMTVVVPIEIRSLINTADEYTAQNILAPMIIKEIREYLNR